MPEYKIRFRVGELVERLKQQFLSSHLIPDTPFLSTRNIAQRFKVSTMTANRAIQELVRQGLLYRKSRSGTYVSSQVVPSASQRTLALITDTDSCLPIQRKGTDLIRKHCNENSIILKQIDFKDLQNHQLIEKQLAEVDGILLSSEPLDPNTITLLQNVSCPIVLMRRDYNFSLNYHQVVLDFTRAFAQIADAINPNQSIWILWETHPNGKYRRNEIMKALLQKGFKSSQIHDLAVDFMPSSSRQNYRKYLDLAPQLKDTFIFSATDVQSDLLLNALMDRGMKPCRDFDLVSCDNWSKYDYGPPGLTSVDCFSVEIAEEALKLLLRLIDRPSECQFIEKRHAKLIVRRTARLPGKLSAKEADSPMPLHECPS